MNKTLKQLAIENSEFDRKRTILRIKTEKNLLENEILKKISDNLTQFKLDLWSMKDEAIFEFEIDDKVSFKDINEEYIWQEVIALLNQDLGEYLKKEGMKLDISRTDKKIKFSLWNYRNALVTLEIKNQMRDIKKNKTHNINYNFDKRMAIHCAKEYIQSLYDMDGADWELTPNHEKLSKIITYLYEKEVKHKIKCKKNEHTSESSDLLVLLIKTHKFKKHTLFELISLGIVAKTKIKEIQP